MAGSKGNHSRICHSLCSKGNRNLHHSKRLLRPSFLPSPFITSIPLNPEATHFLTHEFGFRTRLFKPFTIFSVHAVGSSQWLMTNFSER
jgi:hypothetical protein